MKVLLTADRVGGVFQHSVELAHGLSGRGIEVELALLGPSDDAAPTVPSMDGVHVHEVSGALEWMEGCPEDLQRVTDGLVTLARETRCDLVHLNGYAYAQAADWPVPVVVGAHSSLHGWWEAVKGSAPPRQWDAYRERTRAGLRRADRVVAPTRAMLRELERHYAWLGDRGQVVANGADATASGDDKQELVLWSGRAWDPAKGLDLLDAAAARGVQWPVVAAGADVGPIHQEAPATPHVRRMGMLDEAPYRKLMSEASIYVSTARYEPFGLGPLEAASTGAALVLPEIDTLQEVWGDAAVFYPSEDAERLHQAIARLIEDPRHRQEVAVAVQHRAAQHSRAMMLRGMLQVYDELVPGTAAMAPPAERRSRGSQMTVQEAP